MRSNPRPILATLLACTTALCAQEPAEPTLKPQTPVTSAALASATWLQGEPVKSFEPGKVYILECWATWCGPCIAAIPHIDGLHKKYHDRGLRVIGVNVWEDDLEKVRKFTHTKAKEMSYPIAFTGRGSDFETQWLKAANIRGIPNAFVIRDGKFVMTANPSQLTPDLIEALLAEKADPAAIQAELDKSQANRDRAIAAAREFGTAMKAKDFETAKARVTEVETLAPDLPLAPMMRFELHVALKEWDAAFQAFQSSKAMGRMFTTMAITRSITSGEAHGFTQAMILEVLSAHTETLRAKGEKVTPLDIAAVAALQWHAGNKPEARTEADRALELAQTKPDPTCPPVAEFQHFATALHQDNPPPLHRLQAARKPAAPRTPTP